MREPGGLIERCVKCEAVENRWKVQRLIESDVCGSESRRTQESLAADGLGGERDG
jgi:hypothetical protein